jgi:hypothetical protein
MKRPVPSKERALEARLQRIELSMELFQRNLTALRNDMKAGVARRLTVQLGRASDKLTGELAMVEITTDQQFVGVTLKITDAQGRDAVVDGVPVWASSDETVLSVMAEADGMTATISSVAAGMARVSVSADAKIGAGVKPITGATEDITVTAGSEAANLTLTLPAPSNKADVPDPRE